MRGSHFSAHQPRRRATAIDRPTVRPAATDRPDESSDGGGMPVDSDVDEFAGAVRMRRRRPLHTMKRYLLLVAVGGVFGTGARYEAGLILPTLGPWPVPTLIINLTGAFLLGILLEGLSRRGDDVGGRRMLRLSVGTGFMGSFTTYSTLAVETMLLLEHDALAVAGIYLAVSVIGGVLAGFAGIWLSATQHRSATWKESSPVARGPGGSGSSC